MSFEVNRRLVARRGPLEAGAAIDPVTAENGPVYFVKGSHLGGILPTRPSGVRGNSIGLADPASVPSIGKTAAHLRHVRITSPPARIRTHCRAFWVAAASRTGV